MCPLRQRTHPPQRYARQPAQVPVQGVWVPGAVCAGGRGQGGAVCPGRRLAHRAQFPAQHRARHGRGADDHRQAAKKKRRWPRPGCRVAGRKRPSAGNRKPWNWMSCGPSSGGASAKSGCGWRSNGPRAASWPGCWAVGGPPRRNACGPRSRDATGTTAATTPTSGRPTPRSCLPTTTGPIPKAAARPTLWKPSIAPCASGAAYWSVNPARLAKVYACTRLELKL